MIKGSLVSKKIVLSILGILVSSFFIFNSVFAETAIIISPTESQEIVGAFEAQIDWVSQGSSATCAYVYDDWGPTIFSSEGWTEVSCESAGADILAPNTDGQHTLRVAAWLGPGFTSNATSDYVTFTYTENVPFSGAGAGTEIDPYIITTCEQLQEINNHLSSDFIIGNNIDCVDTESWNLNLSEWVDGDIDNGLIPDPYTGVTNNGYYGFDPIGREDWNNSGSGFTGTLDGQNYTISNLWIFRKQQDNSGLVGYATGATIRNLTINNARIVGGTNTGGFLGYGTGVALENLTNSSGMVRAYLAYNGGGIAGQLENNSTGADLSVIGGDVHGSGNVIGGLVGYLYDSTIDESDTSADVDGGQIIGGVFGSIIESQVSNIESSGLVDSNRSEDVYVTGISKSGNYSGGFAGRITTSSVSNVVVSNVVTSQGVYSGGFVGYILDSTVIDSSARGDVSAQEYVGGFAGVVNNSDIENSSASGDVSSSESYAGGFSGQSLCGSEFLRVSAFGDVQAANVYVGGFTGFDACEGPGSTFTQASAHGDVQGNNLVGGFVGESNLSTFINAYSSGSVSANDQVGSFGGVVTSGSLDNVYASGAVVLLDAGTFVGGFINNATDTTIADSFWDGELITETDACNTGVCAGLTELTTEQAKTQSTYTDAGWDFDSIWEIGSDNDGYPYFSWENFNIGGLLGSGTEQDPYQVTQCLVITESGYYELQNNITDVIGDCIVIEADDVFIDGANHTISGDVEGGEIAIFSEGYDSISISNITLDTFIDGIRLRNAQGTSVITDVTISDMADDGIELRGVSGMTISNGTITTINDEGINISSYFDEVNSANVYNTDVVIQDMVISDIGDYGMNLDYITGLLVTDNEISDTDDDGFNGYVIEDVEILNNSIHDVDSDGIYVEQGVNVLISENTVTNVDGADGIDIDWDDFSSDITITNNILTNIDDVGLEISGLQGGTITGNTITTSNKGIDVNNSQDLTFTENTITPTIKEFFEIPAVTTESIALDILDADQSLTNDYSSFTYTLPFTFNFKGRDITSIEVNVNGSIELLEDGESCQICSSSGRYDDYLLSDVLFASYDALSVVTNPGDYAAVFNPNDEYVVVEWLATTQFDYDSVTKPVHFQVVLYPDGEVQWNFMEMNFQEYYLDMFTGAYDVVTGDFYRAGLAINEPSSYRADFSGDTEYTLTEAFDAITGIDLSDVADSSFIGNSIRADKWVYAEGLEEVVFNDSDSGNDYYLLAGAGAWTAYDITDSTGNGYADGGADRPFSQETLGADLWEGEGEDYFPKTENEPTVVTPRRSGGMASSSFLAKLGLNVNKIDNDKKDDDKKTEDKAEEKIPEDICPADQILTQNLRSGSRNGRFNAYTGAVVTQANILQAHLNRLGFNSGPVDGILGRLTDGAIKRMQTFLGTKADGFVGPITRGLINKSCGSKGLQN